MSHKTELLTEIILCIERLTLWRPLLPYG